MTHIRTRSRQFLSLTCSLLTISLVASCQLASDKSDVEEAFAVLPGNWQDVGEARFEDEPILDPPPRSTPDMAELPEIETPENAPMMIRAVNVHSGREYEISIDRGDLAKVGGEALKQGLTSGKIPDNTDVDAELYDTAVPFGWSNNVDSRTLRSNTTAWPYRAIGTLFDGRGDCTGTLVGPRHVLTAAHCIYNRKRSSWNTITFKPGRNGANSEPYGSSGPHWYWVPQGYIDGASGLNGYDIGLIVLDEAIGSGWMGYGAYSASSLSNKSLYMRGYPRCGVTGAPTKPNGSTCDSKTLWGDTRVCGLGQFFNSDNDGWNREILTNCDGSDGQSGSSFYFYKNDGTPVTMGVFSGHYCLGTCTGDQAPYASWPNVITRLTPTYRDYVSYFRSAYTN